MTEQLSIRSPREFLNWLEDKPSGWSELIALRAAMRVFPIVVIDSGSIKISDEQRQKLILYSWRTSFVSTFAQKYPTDKMINTAGLALVGHDTPNDMPCREVAAALSSVAAASSGTNRAASSAHAARAMAHAHRSTIALVTNNTNSSDKLASESPFSLNFWDAVSQDCMIIEKNDLETLAQRHLWRMEVQTVGGETKRAPNWIEEPIRQLKQLSRAFGSEWEIIFDWYTDQLNSQQDADPFLTGTSVIALKRKRCLALAKKENAFWTISDIRSASQILEEAADILEPNREFTNFDTSTIEQPSTPEDTIANSVTKSRLAVRLQVTSLQRTLKLEEESIDHSKHNSNDGLDEWEHKKAFLEKMKGGLKAIEMSLADLPDHTPSRKDLETASQIEALAIEFEDWIKNNKPEMVDWTMRLGSAVGFMGLFASLGATMPIATPIILLMTCGEKVRDAIIPKKD